MKFTSIFYKVSAEYIRGLPQIHTNEREISNLLEYFSKRVQYIFAVYRKYSYILIKFATIKEKSTIFIFKSSSIIIPPKKNGNRDF